MEEKIYDNFIWDKLNTTLIKSYHNNGNSFPSKYNKLVTELLIFSYITSYPIKNVYINMVHDVDDHFNNTTYLDHFELTGINKKFVMFLNKPKDNGDLIIKNTKYGKTQIECVKNRLVLFPEQYGFCVVPSISENSYFIYGNIGFEKDFN